MLKIKSLIAALGAVAGLLVVSPAFAVPMETFDIVPVGGTSAQCGSLCGTLTLSEISSTELGVSVTLAPGIAFAITGNNSGFGNHPTFELELALAGMNPAVASFSNFSPTTWSDQEVGTSNDFIVGCVTCSGTSNLVRAISFDISVSSGTIGFSNFTMAPTGGNIDLGGPTCPSTGSTNTCNTAENNVSLVCLPGTVCTTISTPEPATIAVFGAGLAGAGAFLRRRKAKKSA